MTYNGIIRTMDVSQTYSTTSGAASRGSSDFKHTETVKTESM